MLVISRGQRYYLAVPRLHPEPSLQSKPSWNSLILHSQLKIAPLQIPCKLFIQCLISLCKKMKKIVLNIKKIHIFDHFLQLMIVGIITGMVT